MQRRRGVLGLVGAVTLLGVAATPAVATADSGGGTVSVLEEGLSSPKGLDLNANGDLVIGQGAFGPPGPALIYDLTGADRGQTRSKTEPLGLVDVAVSPLDGTGWGIRPVPGEGEEVRGHLVHRLADGTLEDVLDIAAFQAADPDPTDQDVPPFPTESNPYGLAADTDGDALLTDAANNDLVRVTPDGDAVRVARFDLEPVATDHLPPGIEEELGLPGPLPPVITAEAVPTTVVVGPDGAAYVGELKGFPFRPGSSRIWRVEPGAVGAVCSVDPAVRKDCRVFASGFTAIQDMAYDRVTGTMYVYELAAAGVLAFEAGLAPGGQFPPAVLLAVDARHPGAHRQDVSGGGLSQPGGVVAHGGHVYLTDGVFTGGRLLHLVEGAGH